MMKLLLFSSLIIAATVDASPALLLTPLVKSGRVEEARNLSKVDPKLFAGVESYSGYFTTDERKGTNMFYWYFPCNKNCSWIIWLQGGPGASSLVGLFNEIGPFVYSDNNLKLRNTSWAKDYSLLFIDNPVGAGFSFTNSEDGYVTNMDEYGSYLYKGLQQFLQLFPALRKTPLYIAGESYAGKFVPALGVEILKHKKTDPAINLQGLIMGNPVIERDDIANISGVYYNWGLIDAQGLQSAKYYQDAYVGYIESGDSLNARNSYDRLLDKLEELSGQPQSFNLLKDDMNFKDFVSFVTQGPIQDAIHVGTDIAFSFSNSTAKTKLIPDFLSHSLPLVEKLLENYRILIYCGQLDAVAACVPSSLARNEWKWSQSSEFFTASRQSWIYETSIAGYIKSGGGLTEAMVRGAGHMTTIDKPNETLQLITAFITNTPLPTHNTFYEPIRPLFLPSHTKTNHTFTVMVISIVLNVVLIATVCVCCYQRLKRKDQNTWLYNVVDERLDTVETEDV